MNKNNFNGIDKNQLNGLLNTVSGKIGVPADQLKKELEEGRFDSALAAMSPEESEKFRMAVKDPRIVEKLMSTPQAKALYKKLMQGK